MLVSPDRYLAGRVAEHHFGATVHVLDDGFQHLQLDRDVDIVIVGRDDLAHPETLPRGRLREPLDTLIAADAIVAADDDRGRGRRRWRLTSRSSARGASWAMPRRRAGGRPMLAVAGIATPQRFFDDLRAAGYDAGAGRSRSAITIRIRGATCGGSSPRPGPPGPTAVLTTEKDFVRLLPLRPFPLPAGWVPLTMEPDPLAEFRHWLAGSVAAARDIIVG